MSDISSSPDKQARAGDSLAFHRIGRLRVPLGKLVEHPKNPNSRAALNGDQVALSSLEADFAEWNEVYGPTFNDDVYCLTGVVRWSRDAPRNAMQELRHLAASGGGDSLLPGYVETVQVASGLHRWNWAREQKLDSLRFELYGPDLNKYASLVSDVTCLLNGDDFKKRRKDLGLSLGHYHRGAYPLALISKLHGSRSAESVRRICNEDAYAKAVLQLCKYSVWRQAFNERHSAFEGFAAKRQAPFATAALERICGLYDAMASAAQAPHRFALDLSKFAPVFQALSNAHIDISLPFDPKADPDVGRKIGNMLQKACDGIGNARAFIDPLVEGMDEWLPALPVLSGQQPKKRADPDVWRLYIPTPWNTVLSPDFSASVQLAANNIMPRMLSALGYPKLALDASWWGGRTDTGDRFRTTISAQWVKSKQSQEPSMAMTNDWLCQVIFLAEELKASAPQVRGDGQKPPTETPDAGPNLLANPAYRALVLAGPGTNKAAPHREAVKAAERHAAGSAKNGRKGGNRSKNAPKSQAIVLDSSDGEQTDNANPGSPGEAPRSDTGATGRSNAAAQAAAGDSQDGGTSGEKRKRQDGATNPGNSPKQARVGPSTAEEADEIGLWLAELGELFYDEEQLKGAVDEVVQLATGCLQEMVERTPASETAIALFSTEMRELVRKARLPDGIEWQTDDL